jgi:hypothetical protein
VGHAGTIRQDEQNDKPHTLHNRFTIAFPDYTVTSTSFTSVS